MWSGIKEFGFLFAVPWCGLVLHELSHLPVLLCTVMLWVWIKVIGLLRQTDHNDPSMTLVIATGLILLIVSLVYEPIVVQPQYEAYKAGMSLHYSSDPTLAKEAYNRMLLFQMSCVPEICTAVVFLWLWFPDWAKTRRAQLVFAIKTKRWTMMRTIIVCVAVFIVEQNGLGPAWAFLVGGILYYAIQFVAERKIKLPGRAAVFFVLFYLDIRYVLPQIAERSEKLFLINRQIDLGQENLRAEAAQMAMASLPLHSVNLTLLIGFFLWGHLALTNPQPPESR